MANRIHGLDVPEANVHVVEVSIVATDAKGARAEGLTAADFRVWDDGKEQTIASLEKLDSQTNLAPTGLPLNTYSNRIGKQGQGSYKVYAWEDIESSAHWDVDFIRPFESRGEPIQVDQGGNATVPLKRISSAEMTDTLIKEGL